MDDGQDRGAGSRLFRFCHVSIRPTINFFFFFLSPPLGCLGSLVRSSVLATWPSRYMIGSMGIHLRIHLCCAYLSIPMNHIFLPIHLHIFLSIFPNLLSSDSPAYDLDTDTIYLSLYLSIYTSIYPSIHLSIHPSVSISSKPVISLKKK
ncbi:hypothetical protein IWX49DRAFT_329264 [Phyllosticta citricarpa]|uniref:Uncharacterized protein n=1 Tax=Phyllosticta citricarpa TaxID=55181 RepID=A0ABR1M8T1_9PEZI